MERRKERRGNIIHLEMQRRDSGEGEMKETDGENALKSLRKDVVNAKKAAREARQANDFIQVINIYSQIIDVLLDGEERYEEKYESQEKIYLSKLLLRRAQTYASLGNHFRAVQDASLALDHKPDLQKAYLRKSKSLMELKEFQDASECLRQGLSHHPNDYELMNLFEMSLESIRYHRHMYSSSSSKASLESFDSKEQEKVKELLQGAGVHINLECLNVTEILPASRRQVSPKTADSSETTQIRTFFARNRSDLYAAFCSNLFQSAKLQCKGRNVKGNISKYALGSMGRVTTGTHTNGATGNDPNTPAWGRRKRKQKSRTETLIQEFHSDTTSELNVWTGMSIVQVTRMYEDQFWEFCVNTEILQGNFAYDAFSKVWDLISERSFSAAEARYILFPKFLEGVVRLLVMRYRNKVQDSNSDTKNTMSVSERLFFGIRHHILGGSNNSTNKKSTPGMRLTQSSTYTDAAKLLDDLFTIANRSTPLGEIRQLYLPQLRKVYKFFASTNNDNKVDESASPAAMSLGDVVYMMRVIDFIDVYNHNLEQVISTVVAVAMLVDQEFQGVGFDEWFLTLVWCCDLKTHDGLVPLFHRFETFIINQVFRPVEAKTNIGKLFT